MSEKDLADRLSQFALDTIKMLRFFVNSPEAFVVRKQLARSATSVGANYEEALGARSRSDFKHKISICLKEMRETHYWLRLSVASGLVQKDKSNKLILEADELKRILGASFVTLNKQNE